MKRIIFLLLVVLAAFAFLTNCSVTTTSYSVVFQNNSDADVTLHAGTTTMWVPKGGDFYLVLYTEQEKAEVTIDGVSIEGVYFLNPAPTEIKSVNLKFNYQHNFSLLLSGGKYYLYYNPVFTADQDDKDTASLVNL